MVAKKKASSKQVKPKAAAGSPKAKPAPPKVSSKPVSGLKLSKDSKPVLSELASLHAKVSQLEQLLLVQSAKLQVMQEVTRVSAGDFALDEMLELFMDVVLRTSGTEHGSIMLLNEDATAMTFAAV